MASTLQEKKLQILSRINQLAVTALIDELAAVSIEVEELREKAQEKETKQSEVEQK